MFDLKEDIRYFTNKKGGIIKYIGECFYQTATIREKKFIEEELLR